MQIKTIKKNIITKLNEWIETITDTQLRKDVKDHLLVSGGSITSMLLNEPINDYDIYIQNEQTLFDLVTYYVKKSRQGGIEIMRGKNKADYQKEIDNRAEFIDNDFAKKTVAMRTLKENQIKLFMPMFAGGRKVNEDKKPEELNYDVVFFSPNAISLSNQIQIVCRFHGNAEQIHKTFDFLHATNYFTFSEGLALNKSALESIITKQLNYQGSLYPLTTIIRVKKFLKRNWNINAGELLKIMFQISELNLKDPDVLEEQLVGVDIAYFGKLIEILRTVDPDKISSGYLNEIIDRVFNNFEDTE